MVFDIYDVFPVNEGHILVISKRHFSSFFEATDEEILAIYELINKVKEIVHNKYEPTEYNIGINIGEDAGKQLCIYMFMLFPDIKVMLKILKGELESLKKS